MRKTIIFILYFLLIGSNFNIAFGQPTVTFGSVKSVVTKIDFTGYPPGTRATEYFLDKGILFTSRKGLPAIAQTMTGKVGVGAIAQDNSLGYSQSYFTDIFIGFVSPEEKLVHRFAKNIRIEAQIFSGGLNAYWYKSDGSIGKLTGTPLGEEQFGPLSPKRLEFTIPDATDGVSITPDSDCTLCGAKILSLSFEFVTSDNSLCKTPTRDADLSFRRLLDESYSEEIYKKLDSYPLKNKERQILLQSLRLDSKTFADEFAIVVRLPPDNEELAQEIFQDMRIRLDLVAKNLPADWFKEIGEFNYFEPDLIKSRPSQIPGIGDIFQVDIYSLDNGDVMMTNLAESPSRSFFRYSTLTNKLRNVLNKGYGRHPNNGSREYGYDEMLDNTYKFYVRGVDQFDWDNFLVRIPGDFAQKSFWTFFLAGIGERIEAAGGEVIYPAKKSIDDTLPKMQECYKPPRKGYSFTATSSKPKTPGEAKPQQKATSRKSTPRKP